MIMIEEFTDEQRKIMDMDYSKEPTTRRDINWWAALGIVTRDPRISRGLYRTEAEQEEYIRKGLEMKLPGQKGYKP